MPVSVNDTHAADDGRIDLVVDRVGIAHQQDAAEHATNDEMLLRRVGDVEQRVIERIEESFRR